MKCASVPSAYRNCILRASVWIGRNFSPARNVRSITAPSAARRSFVRTNAPPLPGLTCWNSMILKTVPSTSMWFPFLNWLVLITASKPSPLKEKPDRSDECPVRPLQPPGARMSSNAVEMYSELQRQAYDENSKSRSDAEFMVAGAGYAEGRVRAGYQAQFVINEALRRRADITAPVDPEMRILDFGCGVGRVMEAVAELGFENVDGVDISEAMIAHASASPLLGNSRFWVTDGHGAGGAPDGRYDLAYSFICMQHISMRQTRIDIIRSLAR